MISADTLDTSHPYSFIKEISTDGNVNTLADLIPKALPVFHVLNPKYTRMFLEPVFRFSKNAWPLNHAVHDIGKGTCLQASDYVSEISQILRSISERHWRDTMH